MSATSFGSVASNPDGASSPLTSSSGELGPKPKREVAPFNLIWSFGVNTTVDMINLTTKAESRVFYAVSNAPVLYNLTSNTQHLLQGHRNLVNSIASDSSGRWLASADKGKDSSILIWDSAEFLPVHTIFNPHSEFGTALLALSGNAKYLVSIGNEPRPQIKFWLWSYGDSDPNDVFTLTSSYGAPCRICFNPNVQEHIWVAFQRLVVFLEWNVEENKLNPPVLPKVRKSKTHGLITDCTYFEKCHQCVASTAQGVLLVFGNTYYKRVYDEHKLQNDKIYVKAIKISKACITCVTSVDGLLMTGDVNGHLKFYDDAVRILFWCQNFTLPAITSISFNLERRNYKLKDPLDFTDPVYDDLDADVDNSDEIELLYANLVPSDATVQALPFVVRNFLIATDDGRLASVNFLENKCDFLNRPFSSAVTAIDAHDELPYLCLGFAHSTICLYNYISKELLAEVQLHKSATDAIPVSYLKYSPQGLHLACGKTNGNLWFIDPISLSPKPKQPIEYTSGEIIKIVFSADAQHCAFYNAKANIVILKYRNHAWGILGKLKSHYKPISDILFSPYLPSRLFTIGEDRFLNEYDLDYSGQYEIVIKESERIEQCAKPVCFIYHPTSKNRNNNAYLFMCDDQFKFKTLSDTTFMCHRVVLGPAYGEYEKSPINQIRLLPGDEDNYLVYANANYLGIQMFPPDGNPHKYIGILAHPTQLLQFRVSHDGRYVFTIGKDDNCVLMWETNTRAVDVTFEQGGGEVSPYLCLIEGGLHGWLFKEMQDLFYYMQILHQGEDTVLPRVVGDYIPVSELPDLMRACGFYPSEYDIENLIVDIKYREFDDTNVVKEEVSFLEFVQLYVNFRPAHGVSLGMLKEKFEYLCTIGCGDADDSKPVTITREKLVAAICERGEVFSRHKAFSCLATLMHHRRRRANGASDNDFSFLPSVINFEIFVEEVLGIDMQRQSVEDRTVVVNDELKCE
ncbi:hypothetical protein PPYR_11559 [Photinus pyralis]|uniref:Cilia- and flagella-associated protein 251 n=1 Tax=Photinus pyralis TaxID=7054 RepID=A0A5N4ABL5_PHOPY|nr:cilia- and flagella-associated protein 251-like [Photinus pyralis]KAB0794720.1 hypothetical protein PPYR_11559 [Photinus pyralis]